MLALPSWYVRWRWVIMAKDHERSDRVGEQSLDRASAHVPEDYEPAAPIDGRRYGSDLIVDALQAHGIA